MHHNNPTANSESVGGIKPSEIRQQLIRGSGNILSNGYTSEGKSLYQNTYVNLNQLKSKVLIGRAHTPMVDMSQSCSIGVVVPDPFVIGRMQSR